MFFVNRKQLDYVRSLERRPRLILLNRRELLKSAGFFLAGALAEAAPPDAGGSAWTWIRSNRTLIAEGYNPPFYPSLD